MNDSCESRNDETETESKTKRRECGRSEVEAQLSAINSPSDVLPEKAGSFTDKKMAPFNRDTNR